MNLGRDIDEVNRLPLAENWELIRTHSETAFLQYRGVDLWRLDLMDGGEQPTMTIPGAGQFESLWDDEDDSDMPWTEWCLYGETTHDLTGHVKVINKLVDRFEAADEHRKQIAKFVELVDQAFFEDDPTQSLWDAVGAATEALGMPPLTPTEGNT